MSEETMVERLAKRWFKHAAGDVERLDTARDDARWWLRAIAEEADAEFDTNHPEDPIHCTTDAMRREADR
jgi:hypothetical protein